MGCVYSTLDSLLFCHSSRLLCELLQEAVPVALQGVGWETWKESEKRGKERGRGQGTWGGKGTILPGASGQPRGRHS